MDISLIIVAAGRGCRFDTAIPKQYTMIHDKTLLEWTILALADEILSSYIAEIIIDVAPEDTYIAQLKDRICLISKKIKICYTGGKMRADTVRNTVKVALYDWVMVHDAARCCITPKLVLELIHGLHAHDHGAILALKVVDTVKQQVAAGVINSVDSKLYLSHTPQIFKRSILNMIYDKLHHNTRDEAELLERAGLIYRIIDSSYCNIKITYPDDICFARAFLRLDHA